MAVGSTGQVLCSINQTAVLLGKSTRTIRRMIDDGTLSAVDTNPHGKHHVWMIPKSEIERLTTVTP